MVRLSKGEIKMDLYRLTGPTTALILSGGMALFFTIVGQGVINPVVFYMLIPAMLVFGFLFDCKFVWKGLMRITQQFKPSYIGSAAYWTIAWPLVKIISDTLAGAYIGYTTGTYIMPYYMSSWGMNGITGYFLYQVMVGTGMGLMWFMAYGPVFTGISHLRVRLGYGDPRHEMSLRQEMAEFGFWK